jgi:hypothetical protein
MTSYDNPNGMAIQLGREGKLYILADGGMLSCLDFKTGKAYYKQTRLPKTTDFRASLVAANGKLYASSVMAMFS